LQPAHSLKRKRSFEQEDPGSSKLRFDQEIANRDKENKGTTTGKPGSPQKGGSETTPTSNGLLTPPTLRLPKRKPVSPFWPQKKKKKVD